MNKRIVSMLLALTLLLSLAACGGGTGSADTPAPAQTPVQSTQPAPTPEPEPTPGPLDGELQKAVDLGLVPETLLDDLEGQISYQEFCAVLDRVIALTRPESAAAWEQGSAQYHSAADKMTVMEGILVLFEAAQALEVDGQGYWYNIPLADLVPAGVDFWMGCGDHYPMLEDYGVREYYNETIANSEFHSWINDLPYRNVAGMFAQRFSYGNGKTYFDYENDFTFRWNAPLTRTTAVRAVERLYETTAFSTFVPAEEIVCTVTPEAIAAGARLPAASWDHLPDWHGYVLQSGSNRLAAGVGKRYTEEDVRVIAEQGFNMIRVQMDYRDLFAGKSTDLVCPAMMENMDGLVNLCAKYGIHICFDMTDMEGFTTDMNDSNDDLFTDPETQRYFADIWRFMAAHYRDVPSSLLSFLLVNEPHDADEGAVNDQNYGRVMRMAIDAIRESTTDRLIIVSTVGANFTPPPESLANAQVAVGCSAYIVSDEAKQWPFYSIGKNHKRGGGDLTLRGDLPAGTKIELTVMQYNSFALTLLADGEPVLSFENNGKDWEGTGLTVTGGNAEIIWQGSGGGVFGYYTLTCALEEPCAELRLREVDDDYYELSACSILTPEASYSFSAPAGLDGDMKKGLTLTLGEGGTVSASDPAALAVQDAGYLRSLLQPYADWRERTGAGYLVLEFGFEAKVPPDVAAKAAEDWFTVLEELGFGWIGYCNGMGPLLDRRAADMFPLIDDPESGERSLYRQGVDYQAVSEHYLIEPELMAVYQKHMGR